MPPTKRNLQPRKNKIRILIVDDHPMVRYGMGLLINEQKDLMVCGEAGDALVALKQIELLKPDLVLVDISLQGMDGIELIKHIKSRYVDLPILVVSMHDELRYAERVLKAGAEGYLMKQEATEQIVHSIRRVLNGEIAVSQKIASHILERFVKKENEIPDTGIESLTDRELEILRLIGQGFTARKIGDQLNLSVKTIESYREHIKRKMKLKNATELIKYAIDWIQHEN